MKYPVACSLFLVAAVGCGEVSTKDEPDAGPEPDAPAEKPVKVRVLGMDAELQGTGLADPNAVAIFVGADGNLVKQGTVGPQGESETLMSQGGLVQTLQVQSPTATTRRVIIMSFHDVKPGDLVNAGPAQLLPNTRGVASTMTGTFTATAGYDHRFETDCGSDLSGGPTVALSLYPNCRGTTVDMLAVQTPAVVGRLVPRFQAMSFPFVAGGPFTIPGNWTDMAPFTIALTNTPEDVTQIRFDRWTQLRSGPSTRIANQNFTTVDDPPAGTVSATLRYPQGVGKRAIISVEMRKAGPAAQRLDAQTQDVVNAQGLDATELPLPWISAPRLNGAERKLTWTETGPGTPDVRIGLVSFTYTRDGISYNVMMYDFSGPSATPEIAFPALPEQYAEFDPSRQTVPVNTGIGLIGYVDQSNIDGYAQARTHGFSLISVPGGVEAYADQAFHRRTTLALVRQ